MPTRVPIVVTLGAVLLGCSDGGEDVLPQHSDPPACPGARIGVCFETLPSMTLTGLRSGASLLDSADLDGDGLPELLIGGGFGSWILSDPVAGPVADQARATIELGGVYQAELAGDLTGDGVPDLVVRLPLSQDGVAVVAGPLQGSLGDDAIAASWPDVVAGVAGDFDGDGQQDLATSMGVRYGPLSGDLSERPLDAATGLVYPSDTGVAAYDPDQSGVDNLLLVGGLGEFPEVQGSALLEDGPPAGSTWNTMRHFSFGMRVLDLADATGDGVPDALLSEYPDTWYGGPLPHALTVQDGWDGGPMVMELVPTTESDWFTDVAVGDLTGDGLPELAVGTASGTVLVFEGPLPRGTVHEDAADHVWVGSSPPSWDDERGGYVAPGGFGWRLHIADLDDDGRAELIVTETSAGSGDAPVVHVAWGGGT